MKNKAYAFCLIILVIACFPTFAFDKGQDLNMPPLDSIQKMVNQAVELAERDRTAEAIAILKKAILMAPSYLKAHSEYIRFKTYLLEKYDEVRAEYEFLMAKEPNNPVYPMALAMGQHLAPGKKVWFEKVVKLAPDWAWGHYAKAALISNKEPEPAVTELLKCIEKDGTEVLPYYTLMYIQTDHLGKIDDALKTAEKMAAQPGLHASGLIALWQWRLTKAKGSDEARKKIKEEIAQLAEKSQDIEILKVAYNACSIILQDPELAKVVGNKIRKIDPVWYPERGTYSYRATSNLSGIPRQIVFANHQAEINTKISEISDKADPKENMKSLENLLKSGPNQGMKWYIYKNLFSVAEKAGDIASIVKYGEALFAADPTDTALLAKMALSLADEKSDLDKALRYASQAEKATSEFRFAQKPANTDDDWFKVGFPEDRQRENYKKQRALSLHALGRVFFQMGKLNEAEAKLRQSIEIEKSEKKLSQYVEVLRKLGRNDEAQKFLLEVEKVRSESVKKAFVNEPPKDFELEGIDGQKHRLSDLKGKVVILNFWATWCGPCAKEMPHLVRLYEKFKGNGLAILAVTVDRKSDRYKVAPFAEEYKLSFPILFDEAIADLYKVEIYPTNIFIDRKGNVRYRQFGFDEETPRIHEIVINELLK